MSKTLFWYIFSQLVRSFLLTSVGLAGITSFAGILRPLTEKGLSLQQLAQMMLYMTPAMCTYCLPVSALFAATVVYGRLSADNEFTAMRAGGISYLSPRRFSVALPGLVMGLLVAFISLVMLCFVVPACMLRVERIIYSNIATVITSQIQQYHAMDVQGMGTKMKLYAQAAQEVPPDPKKPWEQIVQLAGPSVVIYEPAPVEYQGAMIPRDFWMAKTAWVVIERTDMPGAPGGQEKDSPEASLTVELIDGAHVPRDTLGTVAEGVESTTFGPLAMPSPVKESVKFMVVSRLNQLKDDPSQSQRMKTLLQNLRHDDQVQAFLAGIAAEINGRGTGYSGLLHRFEPDMDTGEVYEMSGAGATATLNDVDLTIRATATAENPRPLRLREVHGESLQAIAKEIHIQARPDTGGNRMGVSIDLTDTEVYTPDGRNGQMRLTRSFSVPMSPEVAKLDRKTLSQFNGDPNLPEASRALLRYQVMSTGNEVQSELHSRASFAMSCLALVMMGTGLGVTFRSGDFLTAFAVCFLPALLCITLIICGQQVAIHIPYESGPNLHNPLGLGLWFIWTGNLTVAVAASYVTMKLLRQ